MEYLTPPSEASILPASPHVSPLALPSLAPPDQKDFSMRHSLPLHLLVLGGTLVGLSACNNTRQSNTARTATEQLLIANSIDQSLDKVDFSPLAEASVFVEEKYLDCVDKGYLIASIRHRLLRQGAGIAPKPEEADVILEVRAGAIGTDLSSSFLGVPEITLPGMLTLPEVKMVSKDAQKAAAKIGLVAYDAKTKRLLGEGGVSNSFSDETNTFVFGMGPWQDGTLRDELNHSAIYGAQRPIDHVPPMVTFARPTSRSGGPGNQPDVQLSGAEKEEAQVPPAPAAAAKIGK